MSLEKVQEYFKNNQMEEKIIVLENSSATVEQAALALGCKAMHIAKTMSFLLKDEAILIVTAGDVKIDNSIINAKYVGVQVCAGNLTITGDQTQINTTGTPQEKIEGDGVISDGSAISIIERDGYKDLGTISIENGTFTSSTGVDAIKAYKYNNTDKESVYTIVGTTESDPSKGFISFNSPLASGLIGKEEGEEVTINLPAGETDFEILKIEYKPIVFE